MLGGSAAEQTGRASAPRSLIGEGEGGTRKPGYAGHTAIRHRSRRALIALGAAPRLDQRALAVALEPVLQAFGRSGGRALCLVWTAAPGGRPRSAPTCGAAGSS